jgi:hypothetical protein
MKGIHHLCVFVAVACLTATVNGQDGSSWKTGAAAIDLS